MIVKANNKKIQIRLLKKKDLLMKNGGQRLDKERFSAIKIHNIPNRGRDKGPITRNVQSNKHKANTQVKNRMLQKSTVKCRRANSNKKTNTIVTISDSDDNCDDNNNKEFQL
ncbi:hypothetical protein C1646_741761 [Rhizophagus diaphanus]|nr:hypothetical protein C1646_741761 [Rhizophagus diaphanus] [Rhizophagus sp. MUCL 43196]